MEEEIDLIDYIKVIIKRWKLILAIFLIAVFVGAGVSFTMPKTFQAQAVIKIGQVQGKILETISETIEILKSKSGGNITFSNPAGTSLINIKALGKTPQGALDGINNTVDFLLSRHQEVYNEAKLSLEEGITDLQKQLEPMQLEIEDLEKKIKLEEKTYSEARARILQSYMLNLEQAKSRKRLLEKEIIVKKRSVDTNFESTQLEVSPTLSQNPIKPNIKLNLLVAAVLGIFIGVLVAFAREWWEKENKTIKNISQ